MNEVTPDSAQSRGMRTMDWFVVALVAGAFFLPPMLASADTNHRQILERAATILAVIGCVFLLSWMWFADGAHSCLWRWLPPFWPWSLFLTSTLARWCMVTLLILGTILGIIFSK
jgi:hypothetical protein